MLVAWAVKMTWVSTGCASGRPLARPRDTGKPGSRPPRFTWGTSSVTVNDARSGMSATPIVTAVPMPRSSGTTSLFTSTGPEPGHCQPGKTGARIAQACAVDPVDLVDDRDVVALQHVDIGLDHLSCHFSSSS